MASSGRGPNSDSKSFDFGSDDILCSYEDYGYQDGNNAVHSVPSLANNSPKEVNKSRMVRSSVFTAATYITPDESSYSQGVITTVENSMKKHTDNVTRFLEGISSRLSQLELYCYNLDKSIGEMHSDWVRDCGESDSKLRSLEKHIQEVHRSVQILRDKQELSDTQKELAKLQLAQRVSGLGSNKQPNEERTSTPAFEPKKAENSSEFQEQQLALALPNQIAPQPSLPSGLVEHQQPSVTPQSSMPPQSMSQVQAYYMNPQQIANIPPQSQPSQTQYIPIQSQGQDFSRMIPQPSQPQGNMGSQVQLLPPYQQQWSQQQLQQPIQPNQQPAMQPQIRASSPMTFSSYLPGKTMQQQPPKLKNGYAPQSGEGGYTSGGPRPQLPPGNTYVVFDGEPGRTHHHPPQPQFQQGSYTPQQSQPPRVPSNSAIVPPQPMRTHPYNELIEKLVSMGYRGEHVLSIIQRLEENGQTVDFNVVLNRFNGHSTGSHRGW
ncbi:putative uncharacterized protein DDB_G0294196 isoform X2 [Salvia splendens]|uniref:putative uncharacterized protein DDB_G0294196 isoform X2 n=1 Tax=Salvia splendens TaxID=180675 RepID=UPI001C2572E6|nr:putative uncharacterized protein DDB_G0294196 isoform X2 [Salvia splendens]